MPFLRLFLSIVCVTAFAAVTSTATHSQETSAAQPHVLLSYDSQASDSTPTVATTPEVEPKTTAPLAPRPIQKPLQDPAFTPAAHENESPATVDTTRDTRRLAPPSNLATQTQELPADRLPFKIPKIESLGTAGAGLALVIGLFLLCVALMRRSGPSPTSPLPRDVVAVLGRVALTPKQYAHLLQVGNKLVLISMSGDRTDTITEITDPTEVERLLTLCMKGSKHGSSAEFQQMLQQMAKEPARGFLGGESTSPFARAARG